MTIWFEARSLEENVTRLNLMDAKQVRMAHYERQKGERNVHHLDLVCVHESPNCKLQGGITSSIQSSWVSENADGVEKEKAELSKVSFW